MEETACTVAQKEAGAARLVSWTVPCVLVTLPAQELLGGTAKPISRSSGSIAGGPLVYYSPCKQEPGLVAIIARLGIDIRC